MTTSKRSYAGLRQKSRATSTSPVHLAGSLADLGLIDEYHLYFCPFVLGRGKPYFAGARPPLRLVATNPIGEDAVRLTFVTA